MDFETLAGEPFLVAMAAADPLAARPSLRLADLAGCGLPDGSAADQGPAPGPQRWAEASDHQTTPDGNDRPQKPTTR
ncbi:hypothetical protein [Streptomyces chiangmaiensis]|uniref:Uncharacterized protein n=1 Tax=Streptomyces chiangmaiensis TaxID=766497 RepID=A0ABU7FDA2_9ACTN|nr:hypothetical protein [Streptomyces chiangmaiensis]MED7822074.1 hypothetical protein [Streptomyces chiangmaiensis]